MNIKRKEKFQRIKNLLTLPVNTVVLLVSLVSLAWIIGYKFFFVNQPSLFPKAQEVGEISFNLLSSVVASCIFYYFVVYLEQRRISRELYPSLRGRLKAFDVNIFNIMLGMHQLKGVPASFGLPSQEYLLELSKGIKLSSQPPVVFGNPPIQTNDWFEYFEYLFQSDNYISNLLYAQVGYLPAKIINKLDEIQYSAFQRALAHYRATQFSDDLSDLINPFHYYLQCLSELSQMADSELK